MRVPTCPIFLGGRRDEKQRTITCLHDQLENSRRRRPGARKRICLEIPDRTPRGNPSLRAPLLTKGAPIDLRRATTPRQRTPSRPHCRQKRRKTHVLRLPPGHRTPHIIRAPQAEPRRRTPSLRRRQRLTAGQSRKALTARAMSYPQNPNDVAFRLTGKGLSLFICTIPTARLIRTERTRRLPDGLLHLRVRVVREARKGHTENRRRLTESGAQCVNCCACSA